MTSSWCRLFVDRWSNRPDGITTILFEAEMKSLSVIDQLGDLAHDD